MNDFDQRWHSAIQAARRATAAPAEMPFGFTTRIVARFQETPAEPWIDLLAALGLRALLTSAVLFFASAALVAWQLDVMSLTPTWIETPLSPSVFLP
jgi:hypothetical protein